MAKATAAQASPRWRKARSDTGIRARGWAVWTEKCRASSGMNLGCAGCLQNNGRLKRPVRLPSQSARNESLTILPLPMGNALSFQCWRCVRSYDRIFVRCFRLFIGYWTDLTTRCWDSFFPDPPYSRRFGPTAGSHPGQCGNPATRGLWWLTSVRDLPCLQ